ncbi:putative competence-damage inducible protein [Clostridium homopropionicum DSM 5847]|uniref:Molybdopterin molybdenumtransferase n=1 Tax=Clostridium homopropionicum DSM 5847 TaxID=1121318 RepID=A0A0L6Z6V1_9CLOT|nr:molybdopterin-binding protein [Clostridium homopropionicum]KOA18687.1 putative competence-damage inducible protein [Clostridium homopropionicum DSM 5847]SFG52699.1 molybdenum cofactor cytidylyltransferase [Clostridium homopropionicum]
MIAVPVEKAVGMMLCHDITEIIPGKFKGVAFKKGHIIKEEDIPRLLNIGKRNIYVWEVNDEMLHENEAGERIAKAVTGKGIYLTEPNEGKVSLKAACKGLLRINTEALEKINSTDEAIVATLNKNIIVDEGSTVAGTRIIPLIIDEEKIQNIEEICKQSGPIIWIDNLKRVRAGIITTGSEVYSGRIEDKFGPVIKQKLVQVGSEVIKQIFATDSIPMIVDAIDDLLQNGAEMIIITGGMSVDPDDVTPASVKESGANIISYGAPVLPGSMFLIAYKNNIPILGLPGCVMYHDVTIFDLVLPRILTGEVIKKEDIKKLGHGGLCLNCPVCTFPKCGFGK